MTVAALLCVASTMAQRRVTPIDNPATATQHINENKDKGDSLDRSRLVEMTDNKGNVILVDTITGKEFVDTLAEKRIESKAKYPRLFSASLSIDFFTPAMRALGTKYGLGEITAELNLHNRYIPVIEIGLGQANHAPDDNNYTYHSPVAPFFRIGMNYNFLFKSDPDYLIMAGLRYGFSPFKFEVNDITQQPGYWDEPLSYAIPSQNVTAGYLQLLLALRVRIVDNFSLGWSVRYQSLLHDSTTPYGKAWYIPGFGARNRSINATFSLTYTVSLSKSDSASESTQATIDALNDTPVDQPSAADIPADNPATDTDITPADAPAEVPAEVPAETPAADTPATDVTAQADTPTDLHHKE